MTNDADDVESLLGRAAAGEAEAPAAAEYHSLQPARGSGVLLAPLAGSGQALALPCPVEPGEVR
jgi:hypothetical protein